MGLASVNLMQLALTAAILCEITRNDDHWAIQGHSINVTDFGTEQKKPVCDFVLVNNTNLGLSRTVWSYRDVAY